MPATNQLMPVADHEQAIRLLLSEWIRENKVTAAAFHNRPPGHEKRVEISMFIQNRLPVPEPSCAARCVISPPSGPHGCPDTWPGLAESVCHWPEQGGSWTRGCTPETRVNSRQPIVRYPTVRVL